MYYTLSLHAYDMLDQVTWVVTIREWENLGGEERSEVVLRLTGQFPGEGLDNPTRWLRRALEDIRETL